MTKSEIFEKVENGASVTLFSPTGCEFRMKKDGDGFLVGYLDPEGEFDSFRIETRQKMEECFDDYVDIPEKWDCI